MADLGSIGVHFNTARRTIVGAVQVPLLAKKVPLVNRSYVVYWDGFQKVSTPTNGALTGYVLDGGSPVSRCMVRVYHRASGALIRSVLTANDGSFSVPGLDPTPSKEYFAVAFDPEGGTQYNAMIFDRLTAV